MTVRRQSGLREAHAHIAAFGESLEMTDLAACGSVGECLEMIRRDAVALSASDKQSSGGEGGWVRMHSARIEAWAERRWPTLAELDRASADRPCVILSFDHHAAVANSAALAAAGLRPGAVVPPNGLVCAEPSGNATGVLIEHAAYAAWNAAPEPTLAQRERQVRAALSRLAMLGFTEVHDLHSQPWLGPMLGRLARAGELGASGKGIEEVWLYPPLADIERAAAERGEWECKAVRLAGAKAFADGTINSRTALMLDDYREPVPSQARGRAMLTDAELDGAILTTRRLGIGLAVHAIGDGAVRVVLDAVERSAVPKARGGREAPPAVRIEHAELIDPADVPRFAQLGVVCSVQPCHLLADIEALHRYLPHRLDRVLPLRDLIDAGCTPGDPLWFGSDVPIVRADPADSLLAATTRRREGMPESDAIAWQQRITESEAWAAFGRARC